MNNPLSRSTLFSLIESGTARLNNAVERSDLEQKSQENLLRSIEKISNSFRNHVEHNTHLKGIVDNRGFSIFVKDGTERFQRLMTILSVSHPSLTLEHDVACILVDIRRQFLHNAGLRVDHFPLCSFLEVANTPRPLASEYKVEPVATPSLRKDSYRIEGLHFDDVREKLRSWFRTTLNDFLRVFLYELVTQYDFDTVLSLKQFEGISKLCFDVVAHVDQAIKQNTHYGETIRWPAFLEMLKEGTQADTYTSSLKTGEDDLNEKILELFEATVLTPLAHHIDAPHTLDNEILSFQYTEDRSIKALISDLFDEVLFHKKIQCAPEAVLLVEEEAHFLKSKLGNLGARLKPRTARTIAQTLNEKFHAGKEIRSQRYIQECFEYFTEYRALPEKFLPQVSAEPVEEPVDEEPAKALSFSVSSAAQEVETFNAEIKTLATHGAEAINSSEALADSMTGLYENLASTFETHTPSLSELACPEAPSFSLKKASTGFKERAEALKALLADESEWMDSFELPPLPSASVMATTKPSPQKEDETVEEKPASFIPALKVVTPETRIIDEGPHSAIESLNSLQPFPLCIKELAEAQDKMDFLTLCIEVLYRTGCSNDGEYVSTFEGITLSSFERLMQELFPSVENIPFFDQEKPLSYLARFAQQVTRDSAPSDFQILDVFSGPKASKPFPGTGDTAGQFIQIPTYFIKWGTRRKKGFNNRNNPPKTQWKLHPQAFSLLADHSCSSLTQGQVNHIRRRFW